MSKKAKAAGPVIPPPDPVREAQDRSNRTIVLALLGGKTAPADIARAVIEHPRYEAAIMAFVADVGGISTTNAVYDEIDKLDSATPKPADHVGGIASLGSLSGQTAPVAETDKTTGGERLPYDGRGGWDGVEINRHLSQYDMLAGTDNDGWRCGFATVLAAKVFQGPGSFTNWLRAFRSQNGGAGSRMTPTQMAADKVMTSVEAAVLAGTATYRDLSWLMEALYDYVITSENERQKDNPFYTPQSGIQTTSQVHSPATDSLDSKSHGPSSGEFTAPADVVTAAKDLAVGSNIMIEWRCTKVSDEKPLNHEMMISNQGGTLYIYDAAAPMGLNLRPLSKANLEPYFDTTNYKNGKITFAGTLKPIVPE